MKQYDHSHGASSSYFLDYAEDAIAEDRQTLSHWAEKAARLVFVGELEFFEAWDRLWLSAVLAGTPQLVAQASIGEAFAKARQERIAA